jgi:hypothetical protein
MENNINEKVLFITASIDFNVLYNNLLQSNIFLKHKLIVIHNNKITESFNNILTSNFNENILCFIHSDVYLPNSFEYELYNSLQKLNNIDSNWALCGVAGKKNHTFVGHVLDRGNEIGCKIHTPYKVNTLDEMLIIINKKANLIFDLNLNYHHHWGLDLCLQAKEKNLNVYIIEAYCQHNSKTVDLDSNFYKEIQYIQKNGINICLK